MRMLTYIFLVQRYEYLSNYDILLLKKKLLMSDKKRQKRGQTTRTKEVGAGRYQPQPMNE